MNVVGMDLGIRKIAVTSFLGDTMVHAAVWDSDSSQPRDVQLQEIAHYAHDSAQMANADSVWIEDTIIGNNRRYSIRLAETKGAVMADLANLRFQTGMDIRLVDNQTWKSQVVGNGHASKEDVQNYIRESHPAYAPLCGDDQDLYDAACIGLYGVTILNRAEGLHL